MSLLKPDSVIQLYAMLSSKQGCSYKFQLRSRAAQRLSYLACNDVFWNKNGRALLREVALGTSRSTLLDRTPGKDLFEPNRWVDGQISFELTTLEVRQ